MPTMRSTSVVHALWLAPLLWLSACQTVPSPKPQAAPLATACPTGLPAATRCLAGTDSEGAHYVIAVPATWSGVLVLHAHGGPELGAPKAERALEDLKRWSVMVKAGHAWAGSTFRQGGVAVRAAAEDTERLRRIFVQHVALPQRTVLHGQSWGAGVAAIAAETYAGVDAQKPAYDAVLLSSGLLAGGTRAYDFRLDLRVVYQWLCNNHPKPGEAAYPLWMGLPADARLTRAELAERVEECLGLRKPAAQRSAEQQARVQTIVQVVRIPERSILGHLNWATWHFQDIVQRRTGGLNPFGNTGARYTGSADDAALNAGVLRYRADPEGVRRFGADTDPNGRIGVPVLSVHGINDPIVFVEVDSVFQATMAQAGTADRLVQTFTDDNEHSYLSDPVYPTLVEALLQWVGQGLKPTPAGIAARCPQLEAAFGPGCRFLPAYRPAALDARTAPRQRP
jgi:alpha-beta hydrolase superfamily lysophospholipase